MKSLKLITISLGLMLLTACMATTNAVNTQPNGVNATAETANDVPVSKDKSITETVALLKAQGCNALPPLQHNLLVLLIVSRFPDYPANGICEPDWVNNVLLKQLDKLEAKRAVSH